jgi:hypothetical protein
MNVAGSFDRFADAFPTDLLPAVFALILHEWPRAPRPTDKPIENRITNRFVGHLQNVMRRKSLPSFKFHYRPKLAAAESDFESGEVDIYIDSHSCHPDAYFVFECKRLNVTYPTRFDTEAASYVGEEGMGCFISGQYPTTCECGGMIGYVMDGVVSTAIAAVNGALKDRRAELRLNPPHQLIQAELIADPRVFQSAHRQNQGTLLIYHIFLPI